MSLLPQKDRAAMTATVEMRDAASEGMASFKMTMEASLSVSSFTGSLTPAWFIKMYDL